MSPTHEAAADPMPDFSDRARLMVIVGLTLSVVMVGISLGGLIPWLSLKLEARGTSAVTIGLVAAANPLGIMLVAPFAHRIGMRLGMGWSILLFEVIALPGILLLLVFESELAWFILRLFAGFAMAIPWIIGETWVNLIARPQWRARVMAFYTAGVAAGFALGPLVLSVVGIEGSLPILVFGGLAVCAILPIFVIWRFETPLGDAPTQGFFGRIFSMPVLFMAIILAAMADTVALTFLPIWGKLLGYTEQLSLLFVSIVLVGNVVLQLPIGMIADRIGIRRTMVYCGIVSLIGPFALVTFGSTLVLLVPLLFLWGGAVWALYSLALAELGHRLTGAALAAANGALVFVYTLANVISPPVAGAGLELVPPHGFMVVIVVAAIAFLTLAWVRGSPEGRGAATAEKSGKQGD